MTAAVRPGDIDAARARIAGRVGRTGLRPATALSEKFGAPVHVKPEHHQLTGSFKVRGATNAVLNLSPERKRAGVVAVSTGNHGRGLAHAARVAGIRCTICMSSLVPGNKLAAIRALGAEVRIVGSSQDEAQHEVDRLVAEEGMTALPPFDHPDIIAGQGTVGLEILEDCSEAATVIVPVSGGGLIAGIAIAVKARNPACRIIGVSMERGAAMAASIAAGRPVEVTEERTLADSLGGGIGLDNRHTFDIVRALVDDIVLLDEEAIAAAIAHAYWQEHEIVEGGGAVGLGALVAGKVSPQGPAVVILSGGNIDMAEHHRIVSRFAPATGEEAACPTSSS